MPGLIYNKPFGRIGIFSNIFSKNKNQIINKLYILLQYIYITNLMFFLLFHLEIWKKYF